MPTDAGDKQQASSLREEGSFEQWKQSINWASEHPNLLLMILASFSSPLLHEFKQPGFTLDFCNKTSTGKTTGMNFAASVWGDPDTNSTGSLIKGWDSTTNSIERVATCRTDLPMFMDDTKTARSPEEVAKTIFKLANGKGRGRATQTGGLAVEMSFRNITISTGEDPISDLSPHGGLDARNMEISGPMFTEQSREFGQEIEENRQNVMENFGHAGPMLLSYWLKNEERHEEWKELRKSLEKKLPTRQDNVLNRLAKNMSVIWAGGYIVKEAGLIDIDQDRIDNAVLQAWNVCVSNKDRTEMDISALRCVAHFLGNNADRVLIMEEDDLYDNVHNVNTASYGHSRLDKKWSKTLASPDGDEYSLKKSKIARIDIVDRMVMSIAISGGEIEKCLKDAGYVPSAIFKQWKERGWLSTDSTRHRKSMRKRVSFTARFRPNCIVFNREGSELFEIIGREEESQRKNNAPRPESDMEQARKNLQVEAPFSEQENEESLEAY